MGEIIVQEGDNANSFYIIKSVNNYYLNKYLKGKGFRVERLN